MVEDLDYSLPVWYNLVGSAKTIPQAPSREWQMDRFFEWKLCDMTILEALAGGKAFLGDTVRFQPDPEKPWLQHTMLPCVEDPAGYFAINDEVEIYGSEIGLGGVYKVLGITGHYLLIDTGTFRQVTFEAGKFRVCHKGDYGYDRQDFLDSDYGKYQFHPQSSCVPENVGKLGAPLKLRPPEDMEEYPPYIYAKQHRYNLKR